MVHKANSRTLQASKPLHLLAMGSRDVLWIVLDYCDNHIIATGS